MKPFVSLFVSLAFIYASSFAPAQAAAPPKPYSTPAELVQQGNIDLAISILQTEVEAPDRTITQRGRACALLAYAYREKGNFLLAQKSFDRALRLMEETGDRSNDYAATLDFYAGMLMTTGDLGAAAKALHEAAAVYERLENHAALARIHSHTAELLIERKKYKQANEELAGARAEALMANVGPGTVSEIDATSGWLAVSTGKFHEGVVAYSRSLDECRAWLGEDNAVTGWSYLLLGKAQQLDHDLASAVRSMNQGMAILKHTVGTGNVRYLAGELAYSELLEYTGSHAEAQRIHSAANRTIRNLGMQQCPACTVSVWSLRHAGGM